MFNNVHFPWIFCHYIMTTIIIQCYGPLYGVTSGSIRHLSHRFRWRDFLTNRHSSGRHQTIRKPLKLRDFWDVSVSFTWVYYKTKGQIAATRKTGGSRWGCKPPLLGQRLKALAFTLYGEKFAPAPFSPPRSNHTALHSSLPLKGLCTTWPDP